jgi:16S rRNA (guanine527-N7)-methyltransferase
VSASPPSDEARTDARASRLELQRLLTRYPLDLPPAFADVAEGFVALLLGANRTLNLTRVTEPNAVARLHLLDALSALPILDALPDDGRAALDLGSGGGVPGLVLALARPQRRWVLVDSVRRKADALRGFVAALALANVEVLDERAELLGRDPAHREAYGAVTARACAALPVLAEYALPLLAVGGTLVAWKGAIPPDELRGGEAASAMCGGSEPSVRPSGYAELGDHRFVIVSKVEPTPDRYPRRPGQPSKSPLGGVG